MRSEKCDAGGATDDDLALALTESVVVQHFSHGIAVWKYKIDKSKFGYYVATRQMTKEQFMKSGCCYPRLDSKGRITSFADALEWARDREWWVEKFISSTNAKKPRVEVLNGSIVVLDAAGEGGEDG